MSHDVLRGPAVVLFGLVTLFAGCASNPILRKNSMATPANPLAGSQQRQSSSQGYRGGIARGKAAEQSGNWDRAQEIYEQLIAENPRHAEAYHRLGVIADRQKDFDRAHDYLSQAIRIEPQNAEIWSDMGYCLYLKGDLEQAESALSKAVAIAPGTARFHNNLAMVYGHLGRADEALVEFEKTGSEADAFFNLAFVYSAQKDIENATACIERCLAIDPTHKNARRALDSLKDPDQASRVMPASYEEKSGVHWVPYVEGMEKQEATIIGNQVASTATSQGQSPNRTAGNRVRQLQSRTQTLMSNRMNRPAESQPVINSNAEAGR